jgi:hypothetical protein
MLFPSLAVQVPHIRARSRAPKIRPSNWMGSRERVLHGRGTHSSFVPRRSATNLGASVVVRLVRTCLRSLVAHAGGNWRGVTHSLW